MCVCVCVLVCMCVIYLFSAYSRPGVLLQHGQLLFEIADSVLQVPQVHLANAQVAARLPFQRVTAQLPRSIQHLLVTLEGRQVATHRRVDVAQVTVRYTLPARVVQLLSDAQFLNKRK